MKISIIVPFYKGNKYLKRLFQSVEKVVECTKKYAEYEVVLVNDSPMEKIILPTTCLDVRVIENEKNLGIQGARINGLNNASGDWILFLDQDDEIVADGFVKQLECTKDADVVVGNGIYILGDVNKKVFDNLKCMKYLMRLDQFIKIRNLIPSPGECLIRKEVFPELWKKEKLECNGADDWFLWLLLYKAGAKYVCNSDIVYIHNDAEGQNLSANLDKMKDSAMEMLDVLSVNKILEEHEMRSLEHAIMFKYFQDTKQLSVGKIFKYMDAFMSNVVYRLTLNSYRKTRD